MATFNWHELDHDSFLSWMVIHLVAPNFTTGEGVDLYEELKRKSDSLKNVDMRIIINDVEVPVYDFVDRIQSNMRYYARQASNEIAGDIASKIDDKVREMLEVVDQATEVIQTEVDKFFQE